MSKFEIRNGVIEVEWKTPVFKMKYEGDDTWDADQNHAICGAKLHLTVNSETDSKITPAKPFFFDLLNDRLPQLNLSLDDYSESLRQEIYEDTISFIYAEPLLPLKYGMLTPGIYAIQNTDNTLHSIVITRLFDYQFFGPFPDKAPLKLNLFPDELAAKFWKFYILNRIYFGDENYSTEFAALGKYLKTASQLPGHWIDYIDNSMDDWHAYQNE